MQYNLPVRLTTTFSFIATLYQLTTGVGSHSQSQTSALLTIHVSCYFFHSVYVWILD